MTALFIWLFFLYDDTWTSNAFLIPVQGLISAFIVSGIVLYFFFSHSAACYLGVDGRVPGIRAPRTHEHAISLSSSVSITVKNVLMDSGKTGDRECGQNQIAVGIPGRRMRIVPSYFCSQSIMLRSKAGT